ncbi:bile acid:sodium symporter family protein [Neptuniibacter halophilus]|uniref:bile acid:sodium symporter family protein n=1 Tax=Neptuniibacter halophilus TaxID=651666 RepID=UPI0025733B2B|nr:hypothetical protein [Neptuniibacter halophilus]
MTAFLEISISAVTFLVMWVVGLELQLANLRSLSKQSLAVISGTLAQIICLPALTLLMIAVSHPPTEIAAGMLLVSLCPGGAVSNFYTLLAKGDIAYSVSLTIISTLSSLLSLPLLFNLFSPAFIAAPNPIILPVGQTVEQLFYLLITPLALGMLCNFFWPGLTHRCLRLLKISAAVCLLSLVALIFLSKGPALTQFISDVFTTSLIFTLSALGLGLLAGKLLNLRREQIIAIAIEFPSRNLAIATAIGLNLLQQSNAVLFAAAMFVLQLPVFICVILATWGINKRPE